MNTRTRRRTLPIAFAMLFWALVLGAVIGLGWLIGSTIQAAHQPPPDYQFSNPFSTSTDTCATENPPAPCAHSWGVIDPTPTFVEDQGGMWAILAIGLGAGFLVSACAWLPLYRRGKRDGHAECTAGLVHDLIENRHDTKLYDQFAEDGL